MQCLHRPVTHGHSIIKTTVTYLEKYSVGVVDDDGAELCEGPYDGLLNTIVRHNDVAKLAQYQGNSARATTGHAITRYTGGIHSSLLQSPGVLKL